MYRWSIFLFSFLFWSFTSFSKNNSNQSRNELNICYFSLNSEIEYGVTLKFVNSVNISSSQKINVIEFQHFNSNPEDSFREMVESGTRCDGLVISGHHTGAFEGHRASGSLSIDYLEGLNCDEKYYPWFSNVKALWLQGCRTLGAKIETIGEDADFQTERVAQLRTEDSIEQNRYQMSINYSATLDQSNPLSSRYLRVFPMATTFGWSATAPGLIWKSENSLVYHFANIFKLYDLNGRDIDPFNIEMDEDKKLYEDYLVRLLSRSDLCDEIKKRCYESEEEFFKQAWINHGHAEEFEYAYMNPALNAFVSMNASADAENLNKARINSCQIRKRDESNKEELLIAIDNILESKEVIALSFNSLYEFFLSLKHKDENLLLPIIRSKFLENQFFLKFLDEKMSAPESSIVRKIDYYFLYHEVSGNHISETRKIIIQDALKDIA